MNKKELRRYVLRLDEERLDESMNFATSKSMSVSGYACVANIEDVFDELSAEFRDMIEKAKGEE